MTKKNDTKIGEKLTCRFKNDMMNLMNFDPSTRNLCFSGLFVTKVYVRAKNVTEELCLIAHKIDAKFEGKLTCAFKNDMRNLAYLYNLMSCKR